MFQSCCSLNLQVRNTRQALTPVPTPETLRTPALFCRQKCWKIALLMGELFHRSPTGLKNPLLWGTPCTVQLAAAMGGAKLHAHGWARNKTHLDGSAAAHAAAAVAGRCQRAAAAIGFETGALHEGSVAQELPRCRSIPTVTLCLTPPRSSLARAKLHHKRCKPWPQKRYF